MKETVECSDCKATILVDADDEYEAHCDLKDAGWLWLGGTAWVCPKCKTKNRTVVEIKY